MVHFIRLDYSNVFLLLNLLVILLFLPLLYLSFKV